VEVRDPTGIAISRQHASVTLINSDSIKLEMERSEPANNATTVDTNEAINIYFSRAIDPSLLQIEVKETVHGRDYDLSSQSGAGLTELQTPKLTAINHDMAAVSGSLTHYPGNRYITFNPTQRYAYNADIYVTITYNNAELSRFRFKVKPLPTLAGGRITDQRGIPVTGIKVEIAELGLSAVTNNKGNYLLRSDQNTNESNLNSKNLSGGRYVLSLNPGRENPNFGVIEIWANLEAGELNAIPSTTLPLLSRDIAFVRLSSGQSNAILARGNLLLDVSQARLQFPNKRSSGNVHVQFTEYGELSFKPVPAALPHWMYAVQPSGIKVDGTVGVTINMPSLYGSTSYIPADGTLVVMLGLNSQSKIIEPVGVGRIQNKQVVSDQPLPMNTLDYIGYAVVDEAEQSVLQRFVNGEITQLGQLISELEAVTGQ
jgi:hypothetical protein